MSPSEPRRRRGHHWAEQRVGDDADQHLDPSLDHALHDEALGPLPGAPSAASITGPPRDRPAPESHLHPPELRLVHEPRYAALSATAPPSPAAARPAATGPRRRPVSDSDPVAVKELGHPHRTPATRAPAANRRSRRPPRRRGRRRGRAALRRCAAPRGMTYPPPQRPGLVLGVKMGGHAAAGPRRGRVVPRRHEHGLHRDWPRHLGEGERRTASQRRPRPG